MVPGFTERDARAADLRRQDLFRMVEAERLRPLRPGRSAILRRAWSDRLTGTLARAASHFPVSLSRRPKTHPA